MLVRLKNTFLPAAMPKRRDHYTDKQTDGARGKHLLLTVLTQRYYPIKYWKQYVRIDYLLKLAKAKKKSTMKKIAIAILLFASCSKEEINSKKLSGFWRVREIKTGETIQRDFSTPIYYSFNDKKLPGSATRTGIITADSPVEFKYELRKNTILFNSDYPNQLYKILIYRNMAELTKENGDHIFLQR